jgi:hypothetical protein
MQTMENLYQENANLKQELFEKCNFTQIEKDSLNIVLKLLEDWKGEESYSMCKYSYHRILKFADDKSAYMTICKMVELSGSNLKKFNENMERARREYQEVERELK